MLFIKRAVLLGYSVILLIATTGCGLFNVQVPNELPLQQIVMAETKLQEQTQALLEEAVAAFSDLMPQGRSSADQRPLTIARDGLGGKVLIGGPWRPPFPYPLPPIDKPLFITIKCSSTGHCPHGYAAFLRQDAAGRYSLEWYGAKDSQSVRVPAQVTQVGNFSGATADRIIVKISYNPRHSEVDIIIIWERTASLHIVSSLPPDSLPGRPLQGTIETDTYEGKLKDVCCGRPKPWPESWTPIWLLREDLSVFAVPYDNPALKNATTIENLVDQDLGFLYIRKKPFPGGTTTDCGLNRVWCPPDQDPFLNVRLVRAGQGYAVQFTRLGDPKNVLNTIPAEVSLDGDEPASLAIEDNVNAPEEPTLKFTWPKIKIIIIICKGCTVNVGEIEQQLRQAHVEFRTNIAAALQEAAVKAGMKIRTDNFVAIPFDDSGTVVVNAMVEGADRLSIEELAKGADVLFVYSGAKLGSAGREVDPGFYVVGISQNPASGQWIAQFKNPQGRVVLEVEAIVEKPETNSAKIQPKCTLGPHGELILFDEHDQFKDIVIKLSSTKCPSCAGLRFVSESRKLREASWQFVQSIAKEPVSREQVVPVSLGPIQQPNAWIAMNCGTSTKPDWCGCDIIEQTHDYIYVGCVGFASGKIYGFIFFRD